MIKPCRHSWAIFSFIIVVALLLPSFTESLATAATYSVSTTGSDSNPGTQAEPFLTIAKGLSVMVAGDTLSIESGTYAERIDSNAQTIPTGTSFADAPLITAASGATVTLRPGSGGAVINLNASYIQYVIFKDLHLDGTGVDFGISTTKGANHVRFQSVEVFNATLSGILTTYGGQTAPGNTYHEFLSCDIHHTVTGHGMYISTSSNLIQGCAVHDNARWGIHIFSSIEVIQNNTVRDSEVYNNAVNDASAPGILLASGSGNKALNNIVRGNKNGIVVGHGAHQAKVYNNTVYNNTPGVGILIERATDTTVANNILWANGGGTISNRGTGSVLQTNLTTDPQGVGQLGGLILLPRSPPTAIDPVLSELLQTASPGQLIEAVVTFDHYPTAADLAAVGATGVQVLRFQVLPMVGVRGTADQVSGLPTIRGVRSIYANRAVTYFLDESVPLIGANRVSSELGYSGRGITVAVIDSGIDATHPDLPFGDKVIQNVKVEPDLFGSDPRVVEGLANTDATSGHGTHVSSTTAGTGAALGGKYRGVAIGASLVGVGAGQALFGLTALEGFDWVLRNRMKYGIRVISNSWGTTGAFSADDPVNVASKLAHDLGLVVLFAAGNSGPGLNTLNPYCVAPWVICVAAGHKDGRTLADFSSRGISGDPLYHPTITAPGVDIAAARATTGIVTNTFFAVDQVNLGTDADWYAAASGTSMATPHVSGTVALMLEANPALTPDQFKAILLATAATMQGYDQHEVGGGYLNAHEAVRTASWVSTTSRIEETDPAVSFTGSWVSRGAETATFSGGTAASSDAPGATASLTFTGTAVSWGGLRCEVCGIARARLDGVETTVDTFAPTMEPASSVVFSASGLSSGSHTLVIEVTGTGDPSSGGVHIAVDAFDVTSDGTAPPPAPPPTHFEESAATLSPAEAWVARGSEIATFSDGTAVSSNVAGATATFPFTGTAVSWIGVTCSVCGIATVSIDDGAATTVDTGGPAEPSSPGLTSEVVFTSPTLAAGSHTMVITVTGTTASGGAHIAVDAFHVTGAHPAADTTPPTVAVTSPTSGATVSGTVTVTANATDHVVVMGVQFQLDGTNLGMEDTTAPYSRAWDTTATVDATHTLTATARDGAGNTSTASVTVTVSNAPPPDTTPPTVSITSPANGSPVSGTTEVSADASDNVGVVAVQFLLDGAPLGAEDSTAPYSTAWDTTATADGSHTLTAIARDAAGNTSTASVTVTVSNGTTTVTRFEEADPAVSYSPADAWVQRGPEIATFSGGTAGSSDATGATATFTFTGTAVSWLGLKCNVCGIASMSIDGGAATSVDTAGAAAPGSAGLTAEVVFTASGLAAGSHTMVITADGTTTSGGTHIAVDAFDVTP